MRTSFAAFSILLVVETTCLAGPFAPAAGQPGSTAIVNTSPSFVEWANGYQNLVRGPLDIANRSAGTTSFGDPSFAVGPADGSSFHVVSLGDGGQITLTFARPITNGPGPDLAVFENGFADAFLELAFVEVSTNGTDYARFPSDSETPTGSQVGSFGTLDPTNLDGLAGKYRAGFGTPFDLSEILAPPANVNLSDIRFVRVVDVIGTINPNFASHDSFGHIVNDPYPTTSSTGGFDLNGVGVLHVVPEPATAILLAIGTGLGWVYCRAIRHRPVN